MHIESRGLIALLVLAAVMTTVGCLGGGDQSPGSVIDVRSCLERSAADVMAPLPEDASFGLVLRRHGGISADFVRPPAGSVGLLIFYETEDAASEASEVFKSPQGELLTGSVASKLEVHGKAVLLWRLPVHDSDRSLVAACLESSESDMGVSAEPAKPLGCVQLFLASTTTAKELERIEHALRGERLVGSVRLVSKQAAFKLLRKRHPELSRNLRENPLPDSFRVAPRRGRDTARLASVLRRYPQVDVIRASSLPCAFVEPTLRG